MYFYCIKNSTTEVSFLKKDWTKYICTRLWRATSYRSTKARNTQYSILFKVRIREAVQNKMRTHWALKKKTHSQRTLCNNIKANHIPLQEKKNGFAQDQITKHLTRSIINWDARSITFNEEAHSSSNNQIWTSQETGRGGSIEHT